MESVVLECNSQALEELSRRMSMTETPPPLKVCLFVRDSWAGFNSLQCEKGGRRMEWSWGQQGVPMYC